MDPELQASPWLLLGAGSLRVLRQHPQLGGAEGARRGSAGGQGYAGRWAAAQGPFRAGTEQGRSLRTQQGSA